jgi:hypothetical protein
VTTPILRFPDVQRLLVDDLVAAELAEHAGVETPADFTGKLPFIRVLRIGGGSDRLNDSAAVDVDVFHTTYSAGELLAEQIRQYLCGPPPPIPLLDRCVCELAPRELPWGDGTVRRWHTSYQIVARRHWWTPTP